MHTQYVRRKATVDGFWASGGFMKETTHTTGFTTGVVEVYNLSDVCIRNYQRVAVVCAAVLDGGDAMAEYCQVWDGGEGLVADGGNADTEFC
jgi:hypothetical protein